MKLKDIAPKKGKKPDRRFRVTLTTQVDGLVLAAQTRLNADTPTEAQDVVLRAFRKKQKKIQQAVMHKWDVREVTPLSRNK